MKKISITLFVVLICAFSSQAQNRFAKLTWEIGLPTGDLNEFLVNEDVSFGGVSYDFRKLVTDDISIGGNISWNFFNGSSRDEFVSGNTTISGLRQFYVNTIPVMFNAHYYFDLGDTQLYAGSGVGGVWSLQRTDIGSYLIDNDNFHFGVMPELGVNIPISFTSNLNVSAKYNLVFATSNSINYSFISFGVGWSAWW